MFCKPALVSNISIRKIGILLLFGGVAASSVALQAQDRRSRIDVEQYTVDAEVSPNTQSITARPRGTRCSTLG